MGEEVVRTPRRRAIPGKTDGRTNRGEDEGPDTPLFAPKMRPCRKCETLTVNYYRCPRCIYMDKFWNTGAAKYSEMAEGFSG